MGRRIEHLGDLTPDPRNARKHSPRNIGVISDALREVGAARSIVIDEAGVVLAGNGVVEAAAEAGIERVRVVDADGEEIIAVRRTGLTDEQKTRLSLFDNRANELSSWDGGVLAALKEQDERLLAGLFTTDELDAVLADLAAPSVAGDDPGAAIDQAEELREKWGTVTGQLWAIGRHRLLCGDSANAEDVARLLAGAVAPAVLFDPPYDADPAIIALRWPCDDAFVFTDHRHTLDAIAGWGAFRSLFVWDGLTSWYVPGQPLARAKFCLWFGSSDYDPDGAHYGQSGEPHTVSNPRGTYRYRPDPRGKHLATVYQSPATDQFDGHAHAKPVEWLAMLLANCTRGDVFDPFAGGGAGLVAAERIGRAWYGLEIDPAAVAVIAERAAGLGLRPRLAGEA